MEIPVTIITWLIAAAPILLLILLMVKLQLGAVKAAPIALFISILTSFLVFKADLGFVAMQAAKGIWSSLSVLIVIFPAILIYEITREAGTEQSIIQEVSRITPNKLLQILAIGAVFSSFLQGITGFGVPVAVAAPLLIGIGVKPLWAVIISLIGQSWGGTFGTLAVAWDALIGQTQNSLNSEMILETAFYTGIYIWIWNALCYAAICWLYGKRKGLRKGFPAIIILSVIQGGGQLLMGQISQTLACFLPSCISLGVLIFLGRTRWYREKWDIPDSEVMELQNKQLEPHLHKDNMTIHQAFIPYYFLSLLTVVVLLVKPINAALSSLQIGFSFPEMVTGYGVIDKAVESFAPVRPLTHAGMFLLISAIVGFFYFKHKGYIQKKRQFDIGRRTMKRTMPIGLAVMELIVMSKIMSGTGQTMVLAYGISRILSHFYVIFAPFIGMLGSFMTSSNMSSNILFGEFQLATANLLGVAPGPVLAAQTTGGSIGNMISPGSIILGAATAGIAGSEGKILKKIIPLAFIGVTLIGMILIIN